jgi:hypothetical protein
MLNYAYSSLLPFYNRRAEISRQMEVVLAAVESAVAIY